MENLTNQLNGIPTTHLDSLDLKSVKQVKKDLIELRKKTRLEIKETRLALKEQLKPILLQVKDWIKNNTKRRVRKPKTPVETPTE